MVLIPKDPVGTPWRVIVRSQERGAIRRQFNHNSRFIQMIHVKDARSLQLDLGKRLLGNALT